jgi:hypothetical protein
MLQHRYATVVQRSIQRYHGRLDPPVRTGVRGDHLMTGCGINLPESQTKTCRLQTHSRHEHQAALLCIPLDTILRDREPQISLTHLRYPLVCRYQSLECSSHLDSLVRYQSSVFSTCWRQYKDTYLSQFYHKVTMAAVLVVVCPQSLADGIHLLSI